MYEKLDKLRDEVRRAAIRKKNADLHYKTAQEKLREAENSQILADVSALNLTPEQVAQFLKMASSGRLPKVNPDGSIAEDGYGESDTAEEAAFGNDEPQSEENTDRNIDSDEDRKGESSDV